MSGGIPLVGEAEVSVSASANYQYTWGETHTVNKEFSVETELKAPAGRIVKATFSVKQA